MTMRLYSAGLQVFWAIIKVRRAIVSHDASIISAIIKGTARVRWRSDLRIVSKKWIDHDGTGGDWDRAVSRCSQFAGGLAAARHCFRLTFHRLFFDTRSRSSA
jgi:hypothetical protein